MESIFKDSPIWDNYNSTDKLTQNLMKYRDNKMNGGGPLYENLRDGEQITSKY